MAHYTIVANEKGSSNSVGSLIRRCFVTTELELSILWEEGHTDGGITNSALFFLLESISCISQSHIPVNFLQLRNRPVQQRKSPPEPDIVNTAERCK